MISNSIFSVFTQIKDCILQIQPHSLL